MQLTSPIIITPRLMAGLRIGDGWISIGYSDRPGRDGRTRYKYAIDSPDCEYEDDDLQSGCCGGSLQDGLSSLLSFLGAAAESYRHAGLDGENSGLFPETILEWAAQNSDELQMAQIEIEESGELIAE